MALFLTAVLILSSGAMIALLYIKHWELTTGKVIFQDVRPRISEVSHTIVTFIERHLPAVMRRASSALSLWMRTTARAAVARGILAVEHALEEVLTILRKTTQPPANRGGQVSAFLHEVAVYKKQLMRRTKLMQERQQQDNAQNIPPHDPTNG